MSFHVAGIGSPIVDYTLTVDDEFLRRCVPGEKGGTVHIDAAMRRKILSEFYGIPVRIPGGSAANTVSALAHLGISASFAGKLGHDEDGKFFLDAMTRSGVDCSSVTVASQGETGCCILLVTPDAERTMRSDLGVSMELAVQEIAAWPLAHAGWVHVEGYMLETDVFPAMLEKFASAHCRVSLDLAGFELVREKRKEIMGFLEARTIDLLFANAEEAAALTGENDPRRALETIRSFTRRSAVKCGAAGSLVSGEDGEIFTVPAFPVDPVVDTTAAGDHYAAGFFYGMAHGAGAEICGRCGSLLASEIVRRPGAKLPDECWKSIIPKLNREIGK